MVLDNDTDDDATHTYTESLGRVVVESVVVGVEVSVTSSSCVRQPTAVQGVFGAGGGTSCRNTIG